MKDILLDTLITSLPEIVAIIMVVLSAIVSRWLIPLIKGSKYRNELEIVMMTIRELVKSAQRLDKTGKLENITKKEYVMEEIMKFVENSGYNFTEKQLDDIRRAAVLALENAEQIIHDANEDMFGQEDSE